MIKKTILIGAGALLVLGLLFGRNLIPYAETAFHKVRTVVNDQVDTSFQIDVARRQLEKVRGEIEPMLWKIAKEQVAVERLAEQLEQQETSLANSEAHILKLRDHLSSGDATYVSHGVSYGNHQVKKDLASHFERFKTAQNTYEQTKQILQARQQGLNAAHDKLKESIAQRKELEVQIENLEARKQMIDVAKTAGKFQFDNSELSQARQMIEDIKTRLDVENEMMNLAPIYSAEIPMDDVSYEDETDIVEAVDAYFSKTGDGTVVKN